MHQIVAVLGTRYPDLRIEEAILGPLGVELRASERVNLDADAIVAAAAGAEVILAGSRPRFDRATLARLDGCRAIVRYGVGTDSIDLAAARERRIGVVRVSDYGTEAVAVHAVTLAMSGTRRLVAADDHVRAGGWGFAHLRPLHLPSASTAGVIGLGRIGRRVATLFKAFGFPVVAFDPYVDSVPDGVTMTASIEELLTVTDVISLHTPGNPDGSALLGARELAACREGSVLVNTARGTLIDTTALVEGLRTGRPAVAALDVFDREPVELTAYSDVLDRVILTPHMAWYSEESERDLRTKAAERVADLLRGATPADVVVGPFLE